MPERSRSGKQAGPDKAISLFSLVDGSAGGLWFDKRLGLRIRISLPDGTVICLYGNGLT